MDKPVDEYCKGCIYRSQIVMGGKMYCCDYIGPHKKGGGGVAKKSRYAWWPYIKAIVRAYPGRVGAGLSGVALREYEAVRDAVEVTERMPDAVKRLEVIRQVHFEGTYTLEGAALRIPCGQATAARWQRKFFEEVARNRDLLD